MELLCAIYGTGPIAYQWSLRGEPVVVDGETVYQEGRSLLFTTVTLANAGEYQCYANNSFSENTVQVNVTVLQEPYLVNTSSWDTYYEVQLGYNLSLRCPAAGIPTPLVFWYRDDQLLNLTTQQLAKQRLDIVNATRTSDRATFKYVYFLYLFLITPDRKLPCYVLIASF